MGTARAVPLAFLCRARRDVAAHVAPKGLQPGSRFLASCPLVSSRGQVLPEGSAFVFSGARSFVPKGGFMPQAVSFGVITRSVATRDLLLPFFALLKCSAGLHRSAGR